MRTTLTLDEDVAALLKEEARRTGGSFKATVNQMLRLGFVGSGQQRRQERFVVTPLSLNTGLGTRYQKVEELLEAMEGRDDR